MSATEPTEYEWLLREFRVRTPNGWYGYSLGPTSGWLPLLAELHAVLEKSDPNYEVHQIKEKFGELRVYLGNVGSEEGCDALMAVEDKAWKTCYMCGAPGIYRSNRGRPLCDEHA